MPVFSALLLRRITVSWSVLWLKIELRFWPKRRNSGRGDWIMSAASAEVQPIQRNFVKGFWLTSGAHSEASDLM